MRGKNLLQTLLSALLLILSVLLIAEPASATPGPYVAVGDSYSAGEGSGDYTSDSGSCHRSPHAHPQLWASANNPSSFVFAACSGATTQDVINNQLGALTSSTTLVSIGVGGNDANFAGTMQTCVLQGIDACLSAVDTAKNYANSQLPARLDQIYSQIRNHAPNARVVVLGYPHLYKISGSCAYGIGDTSRTAIDSAADTIDTVISTRAAAWGFTFGDVRGAFTNHEICSGDWWLNSTVIALHESYHPNAKGQANGYLPTFSSGT